MPASGDFKRSLALQNMFAGMSQDGMGATRAAMQATEQSTADCFKNECDPAGHPWKPLAPSTLIGRKPGPKLGGLVPDLFWQLLAIGKWAHRSRQKFYAVYHLGPDGRTGRPERPYHPIQADEIKAVGEKIFASLRERWLAYHRQRAGV